MSEQKIAFTAKLFYSYCHKDIQHKDNMNNALSLLRRDNLLRDWDDQHIIPGKRISSSIRTKMAEADILVFLISQHFIASPECMNEWQQAKPPPSSNRPVFRIPIILEDCAWRDLLADDDIKALPTDATPVCSFGNQATAWHQVYDGIKEVISKLRNNFQPKASFTNAFEETEFISQNNIRLPDIFIFPRFTCYTSRSTGVQLSDDSIANEDDILSKRYSLVHGESMSGKTTLGRHLFLHLVHHMSPVLHIDLGKISGKPTENAFRDEYGKQFHGDYFLWKGMRDKTLILDNLTSASDLIAFVVFSRDFFDRIIVILSSDIYVSFFKDDARLADFYEMKIEPLTHSQQEALIRRRLACTLADQPITDGIVDRIEDRVNAIIISNKIVPRYPFYVLSILQTYEAFMPSNLSISSFGHCYHALIVANLIKAGISEKDSDINVCFNFAERLAFSIYEGGLGRNGHGQRHFQEFVREYCDSYVMPESTLNRLKDAQYGIVSSCGQFRATYMYFFFLGRFFAKATGEQTTELARLCDESYVSANHLILLFVIHHTDDNAIIEEILLRTMCTLEYVEPAVLDKEENSRFFKLLSSAPKTILRESSVEAQRAIDRKRRDDEVELSGNIEKQDTEEGKEEINDIYRILKINQILGQILRNKYGSLRKTEIEQVVEVVADGGLRLINLVLMSEREIESLAAYIRQKNPKYKSKRLERMLRFLAFVWTMVNLEHVVHAINVPQIRNEVRKVVRDKGTPAYELIGYFNHLDSVEKLSPEVRSELEALLRKYRDPFMRSVLSLRTQYYMNTHASDVPMEQSVCSLLQIDYVYRQGRSE